MSYRQSLCERYTSGSGKAESKPLSPDELKKLYAVLKYRILNKDTNRPFFNTDFDTFDNWHLLSPEQIKKHRIGICYDTAAMTDRELSRLGIPHENYFAHARRDGDWTNDPTHAFNVYRDDDGNWRWLEGSWGPYKDNGWSDRRKRRLVRRIVKALREASGQSQVLHRVDSFPEPGTGMEDFYAAMAAMPEKKAQAYEPPWTIDRIRKNLGDEIADRLAKDPVHRWRSDTGIELVHKEPTRDELLRIIANWRLMSDEQKRLSDEKSRELFGVTNEENARRLLGRRRRETYESGSGKVESYRKDKTNDHDEIVLRLKDGRRVVISNNTKLGIRVEPAEGDTVNYHGHRVAGTDVVHKVHPNRRQRGGWLEHVKAAQAAEDRSMRDFGYEGLMKLAAPYTVAKGDTLSGIAARHRLKWQDLASWNGLSDPGKIRPGQVLQLEPPSQEPAMVEDSRNPRRMFLGTSAGKRDIVTYPQKTYSLPVNLPEGFAGNLASQLALEAGPRATPEQMRAILDVAVNRGSGSPSLIARDMGSAAWESRSGKGVFGRPDIAGDKGYDPTRKWLLQAIQDMSSKQTPTTSDHTMFRHTSNPKGALPAKFSSFPQSLTGTNVFSSAKGPHLVTYRSETFRHSHPEKPVKAKK